MKIKVLTVILIFLVIFPGIGFAQSGEEQLKDFEEEVFNQKEEKEDRGNKDDQNDEYTRDEEEGFWEWVMEEIIIEVVFEPGGTFIKKVIFRTVTFPYRVPYQRIEKNRSLSIKIQANNRRGYDRQDRIHKTNDDLNFRMGIAGQYVFDDIRGLRVGTSVIKDRWAFNMFRTEYSAGEELLYIDEGTVTFTFARNKNWEFESGLGLQSFRAGDTEVGLKYVYNIKYKNSPLNYYLDFGTTLFNNQGAVEFNPGLAYKTGNSEFKFGYRGIAVGNELLFGPEVTFNVYF